MLQKALFDFFFGFALGAQVMDDAHRAHAGHHAPGRVDAGKVFQQAEFQLAQGIFGVSFGAAQIGAPIEAAVLAYKDQVGHFVAFRQDEILGFRQGFRLFGAWEKDTGRMLGFVTGGGAA